VSSTQSDYIRTNELQDAVVALADLPALFGVDARTIRRWVVADGITTFPHPVPPPNANEHRLALRWGDVPIGQHATRWKRRKDVR
jgi:hypothetical protein